jgi:hypothetical protein
MSWTYSCGRNLEINDSDMAYWVATRRIEQRLVFRKPLFCWKVDHAGWLDPN